MKPRIEDAPGYNREFPELYPWAQVDQITISALGEYFSIEIERDLKTADRLKVPGLRHALNLIAETYSEE